MNTAFDGLGLSKTTLSAVEALGYTSPTPVQEQVIPIALSGHDVVACAQTGTGKTAAFALPMVDRIKHVDHSGTVQALVVSPTRELAQQTSKVLMTLSRRTKQFVLTVTGGAAYGPQIKQLKRGVDILIATPGRLADLMERNLVDLGKVEMLVLDEADRMLDMGFLPVMQTILAATPQSRQTMLFSATIEKGPLSKLTGLLNDPTYIEIAHHGETASAVEQYIVPMNFRDKPQALRSLLDERGGDHVIVFTRTKAGSDRCVEQLRDAGFDAEAIHSDKSQRERQRALSNFADGRTAILVATDVLARGIDVTDVEQVVNYDLPDCSEDYIHRIGRTGRAGKTGVAISFVDERGRSTLRDIERLVGRTIPSMEIPGIPKVGLSKGKGDRQGGEGRSKSHGSSRSYRSDGNRSGHSNGNRSSYSGGKRSDDGRPSYSGSKRSDGNRPTYTSDDRPSTDEARGSKPETDRSMKPGRYSSGKPVGNRSSKPRQDGAGSGNRSHSSKQGRSYGGQQNRSSKSRSFSDDHRDGGYAGRGNGRNGERSGHGNERAGRNSHSQHSQRNEHVAS